MPEIEIPKFKTKEGSSHFILEWDDETLRTSPAGGFFGSEGPAVGDLVGGGGVVLDVQGSAVTVGFPRGVPEGPVNLPWVKTTIVVEQSSGGGRGGAAVGNFVAGGGGGGPAIGDLVGGGGVVVDVQGSEVTIEFPRGVPEGPVNLPWEKTTIVVEHTSGADKAPASPGGPGLTLEDYTAVDEDGMPTPLLPAGLLRAPIDWPNTWCEWVLFTIDRLLNGAGSTTGVKVRYQEMLNDDRNLFIVRPTGQDSWESHQTTYLNERQGLRNRLQQWKDTHCDDDRGGPQLPADLSEWIDRDPPKTPARFAPPIPSPDPSSPISLPSWEQVAAVAIILGIGIQLVDAIIVALADPEPVTKLAALGLSVALIIVLLDRLGIPVSA
jgi:hypothetical protein